MVNSHAAIKWDDPATDTRLRDMVTRGLSAGEIARALNCSRSAVLGRARRIGLRLSGRPATVPVVDAALVQQVVALNAAGLSYRAIARRLGCSADTAQRVGKTQGLTPVRARAHDDASQRERLARRIDRQRHEPSPPLPPLTDRFAEGYLGQTGRLALVDLKGSGGQCRFPVDQPSGPVRFCGASAPDGSSWCAHHAARVFAERA